MKNTSCLLILAAALAACGGDSTGTSGNGTIQLSAAQSDAIKARVAELAPVNPELAWLADTIQYVVTTGVTAHQVVVATDLGSGPWYAVSLERGITTSVSKSMAFDAILFNDPSNPTDFIIASGWTNPGNVATAPTSVSGTFGSPTETSTVNAELFHVNGQTVSAWRAVAGTATFTLGESSGTCTTIENSQTVTCQNADLGVTFSVSAATADNDAATGTKSAGLQQSTVTGIIVRMLIQ